MGIDYNQQKFEEFDIRIELGVDVALPFFTVLMSVTIQHVH